MGRLKKVQNTEAQTTEQTTEKHQTIQQKNIYNKDNKEKKENNINISFDVFWENYSKRI